MKCALLLALIVVTSDFFLMVMRAHLYAMAIVTALASMRLIF